jgi:hypothetical protein
MTLGVEHKIEKQNKEIKEKAFNGPNIRKACASRNLRNSRSSSLVLNTGAPGIFPRNVVADNGAPWFCSTDMFGVVEGKAILGRRTR